MFPIAITQEDRGNRFLFVRKFLPTASIMPCKLTQQTSIKLKANRPVQLNILAKLQSAEKKGGPIL